MKQPHSLSILALLASCTLVLSSCSPVLNILSRESSPEKESTSAAQPSEGTASESIQPPDEPKTADASEDTPEPQLTLPAEVRDAAVQNCTNSGQPVEFCSCVTDKLLEKYDLSGFLELNDKIQKQDPEAMGEVLQLTLQCAEHMDLTKLPN